MTFDDWVQRFTSLFVAVNFPEDWSGSMVIGKWTGDQGGPREMSTWVGNPKLRLKLKRNPEKPDELKRQIFLGLYINDPRLVLGKDYYKDDLYKTAMGFDVVTETDIQKRISAKSASSGDFEITGSTRVGQTSSNAPTKQPPYMYGSTQVETMLTVEEEYFIVPSLNNRKQAGVYYIHAYSEYGFEIEGGVTTIAERTTKDLSVGNKVNPR